MKNALEMLAALPCPPDYVLIHDGARPFISQKVIADCIAAVRQYGSAVCALPCTDTAVRAQSGFVSEAVEREGLFTLQTPQGFSFPNCSPPTGRSPRPIISPTIRGMEKIRRAAPPVRGNARNRKLTFAEDFMTEEYRTASASTRTPSARTANTSF